MVSKVEEEEDRLLEQDEQEPVNQGAPVIDRDNSRHLDWACELIGLLSGLREDNPHMSVDQRNRMETAENQLDGTSYPNIAPSHEELVELEHTG